MIKKIGIILITTLALTVSSHSASDGELLLKKNEPFKHDTPLIKTDVKKLGKKELEKSAEMGPTPVEGDVIKLKKRKQISSVKERNYLLIRLKYLG